jgi:hypothetical protein
VANALTLIMPLKEGVDLQQLGGLLTASTDRVRAAMNEVGTVHDARFVVFDASTETFQPGPTGPYKLGIITTYDGDFDTYIQDFVNNVGAIFDLLLSVTSDGSHLVPTSEHVADFTAYVSSHDLSRNPPSSAFPMYTAYPCTVQEVLASLPSDPVATS